MAIGEFVGHDVEVPGEGRPVAVVEVEGRAATLPAAVCANQPPIAAGASRRSRLVASGVRA